MEFDKSLEHKIMTLPRCWFKREKLACHPQPLHFLHNQGQQLWLQSTNMNLPWICTSSLIFNNNNLAKWVAFLWVQILLRIQIVLPMNRSQLNSKNHSIISIQFLFPGKRHASPTLCMSDKIKGNNSSCTPPIWNYCFNAMLKAIWTTDGIAKVLQMLD